MLQKSAFPAPLINLFFSGQTMAESISGEQMPSIHLNKKERRYLPKTYVYIVEE